MPLRSTGKRAAHRTSAPAAPAAPAGPAGGGSGAATTAAAAAPVAPPAPQRPAGWKPLGELLVERRAVNHAQLAEVLLQQSSSGKPLGMLLVETGLLDERVLAEALAEQYKLPLADLRAESPEADAPSMLPESIARSLTAMPLGTCDDGSLEIAIADPREHVRHEISTAVGGPVSFVIATQSEIRRTIDRSYRALGGIDHLVKSFQATEAGRVRATSTSAAHSPEAGLAVTAQDAPVVQVVNMLVTQALRDRASDLHLEPQDDRMRVRFRIDGALHDVLALPSDMSPALTSRIKIMAGMNIVERRRPQDGQFAMNVDGRDVDFRVSTTATIWGEKVVLRILDKSKSLFQLADLGMPKDTHEVFSKMIRSPFGMVLLAGPTGSGKTTTLYAALSEINEPQRNIMTIEDPVEYVFPSINQIQTNEQAGLSFATGLKSILRQDPDVILVGESRDVDTARIAVQSALTGHFVLTSLHATDSVAALHRFLDMGIESFLIASSVVGIVGQRLVRRTCTQCKAPYEPTSEELAFYEESGGTTKKKWFAGTGCAFCSGTGYQDRIGVYELLRVTPEIKRLVVGWATQEELRRMAVSQGMRTLRDEGIALVQNDVTTISEIVRSIYAF